MKKLLACIYAFLIAISLSVSASAATLNLNQISEAGVRITSYNAIGSGTCIWSDENYYYILTNAHVTDNNIKVDVEFFHRGQKSTKVTGDVVWKKYTPNTNIDFSIVRVVAGDIPDNFRPRVIPLLPKQYNIKQYEYIAGAGCPNGNWLQAWEGFTTNVNPSFVMFNPSPVSGQSGTGVTVNVNDETYVAAILGWSIGQPGHFENGYDKSSGAAVPVAVLFDAMHESAKATTVPDNYYQTKAWVCPTCRKCEHEHALGADGKLYCVTVSPGGVMDAAIPNNVAVIRWPVKCDHYECRELNTPTLAPAQTPARLYPVPVSEPLVPIKTYPAQIVKEAPLASSSLPERKPTPVPVTERPKLTQNKPVEAKPVEIKQPVEAGGLPYGFATAPPRVPINNFDRGPVAPYHGSVNSKGGIIAYVGGGRSQGYGYSGNNYNNSDYAIVYGGNDYAVANDLLNKIKLIEAKIVELQQKDASNATTIASQKTQIEALQKEKADLVAKLEALGKVNETLNNANKTASETVSSVTNQRNTGIGILGGATVLGIVWMLLKLWYTKRGKAKIAGAVEVVEKKIEDTVTKVAGEDVGKSIKDKLDAIETNLGQKIDNKLVTIDTVIHNTIEAKINEKIPAGLTDRVFELIGLVRKLVNNSGTTQAPPDNGNQSPPVVTAPPTVPAPQPPVNTDNTAPTPVDPPAPYIPAPKNTHIRIKQWAELKMSQGEDLQSLALLGVLYREATQQLRRGALYYKTGVKLQGQEITADKIDAWVKKQYISRVTVAQMQFNNLWHEAYLGFLYKEAVDELRKGNISVLGAEATADALDDWVNSKLIENTTGQSL